MKTNIKKRRVQFLLGIIMAIMATSTTWAQSKISVKPFDKVIVSPHIEVTFVEGNEESVVIENARLDEAKFHVEQKGNSIHLYLDGAKTVTKTEKYDNGNYKGKRSIYQGTMITATVSYKTLSELSLRGEEVFVCESPLATEKFGLTVYGESKVYLNTVHFDHMKTTLYGESYVEIKNGSIGRQKITAYGETTVNTTSVKCKQTKITAYGEGSYRVNAEENLKVTAFGEATVAYTGNANVDKGLIIGEAKIQNIN